MRPLILAAICLALATAALGTELAPGDAYLPDGTIERWDGGTECACWRPDAGACRVPTFDGGTTAAPGGVTLGPGWSGPGCLRKACREPAGQQGSSWPKECR